MDEHERLPVRPGSRGRLYRTLLWRWCIIETSGAAAGGPQWKGLGGP